MRKLKVAIQGQEASFHDVAAHKYFGNKIETVKCKLPFDRVFNTLKEGKVDFAVCAIENSIFGSINDVYDLLLEYRPWISGEVYLRIKQCLVGLKGTDLKKVKEIHSHPVALAQCKEFIEKNIPNAKLVEENDTAGSIKKVVEMNDPTKVAIGPKEAADLYGAKVLKKAIETNHENYTRFVILSRKPVESEESNKTSVVIEALNKAGSLHKVLGVFASRDIDLTLITSRPLVGKPQSYMFYLDFAAGMSDDRTQEALDEAKEMGCEISVLGSYIKGKI